MGDRSPCWPSKSGLESWAGKSLVPWELELRPSASFDVDFSTSDEQFNPRGHGARFPATVSRETYVSWESQKLSGPTLTPNFSFDMERRRGEP